MHSPNTFIVGAPKCGTTAMVRYLGAHPNAFFSKLKEPGYWATDYQWLAQRNALHSLEDYLRLFSEASGVHKVVGEASTMYLSSECAVANILAFFQDARFIVMLRNPVEVAQAYHMQKLLMFQEDVEDFETAWRLQDERRLGRRIPRNCPSGAMLQYADIARFGPQVARMLRTVPRQSVHFIRYDAFKRDTAGAYRDTLRFLGLKDDGRKEFPVAGPARRHRFAFVARLFHDPPVFVSEPIRRLSGHLVRKRYPPIEALRQRMFRPAPRPQPSDSFRAELQAYFRQDVDELERLLGWDLQQWRLPADDARSTAP
jgi:Sulfotransferase domain